MADCGVVIWLYQGGSRHGEGEEQRERRHSARGGVPAVAAGVSSGAGMAGGSSQQLQGQAAGAQGPLGFIAKHRVEARGDIPITPSGSGSNLVGSSGIMPPPPPSSSQQQANNNSTG